MTSFARLGLPEPLVRALATKDITEPFPIQTATIPDALAGRDTSGKAPTGSGKTLAFGLPVLARVEKAQRNQPSALILALNGLVVIFVVSTDRYRKRLRDQDARRKALGTASPPPEATAAVDDGGGGEP